VTNGPRRQTNSAAALPQQFGVKLAEVDRA
jgi:hypothetical protein